MSSETLSLKSRPKRIPIGGNRDVLTVADQDPNYVYRFVNDTPGRIERFKEAGYEVVTANLKVGQRTVDQGSQVGAAVTKNVGGLVTGVLMRIPKEYYIEDQKAKQERIDALESSMRAEATQGRYGKLEISRSR